MEFSPASKLLVTGYSFINDSFYVYIYTHTYVFYLHTYTHTNFSCSVGNGVVGFRVYGIQGYFRAYPNPTKSSTLISKSSKPRGLNPYRTLKGTVIGILIGTPKP